jgi:hypothetical protein
VLQPGASGNCGGEGMLRTGRRVAGDAVPLRRRLPAGSRAMARAFIARPQATGETARDRIPPATLNSRRS